MNISKAGLDLLRHFEGCRLEAYKCSAGVWTIGVGHTGPDVFEGLRISEAKAEDLLRSDLKIFEIAVAEHVKVPLNNNQFDALVCFVFNIGRTAFSNSTLLKLLNDNADKKIVAAEFQRWNKVDGKPIEGLTRRRRAESELFLAKVPNTALASSIIAQQDTWLKREPIQSDQLVADKKLFVPKGSAHIWDKISILPGEVDYQVQLAAQPDRPWYFYPQHWKIINDPKSVEQPESTEQQPLVLDVPYYSQRDNYRDANRTCFSSSCAMLLKYLKPNSIKNDDDYVKTVFGIGDTTEAWVQLEALKKYGLQATFRQNCGWNDLDALLAKGIPVPIGILHHGPVSAPTGGGHWIIVIGRSDDGASYVVNDPWGELALVDGTYVNTNGAKLKYSKKNLGPRFMPDGPGSGWIISASKP